MEEKVLKRLKDLYISRQKNEQKFVVSLRYNTTDSFVKEMVDTLTELRGRIQEIEYFLEYDKINALKKELDIDFN